MSKRTIDDQLPANSGQSADTLRKKLRNAIIILIVVLLLAAAIGVALSQVANSFTQFWSGVVVGVVGVFVITAIINVIRWYRKFTKRVSEAWSKRTGGAPKGTVAAGTSAPTGTAASTSSSAGTAAPTGTSTPGGSAGGSAPGQ